MVFPNGGLALRTGLILKRILFIENQSPRIRHRRACPSIACARLRLNKRDGRDKPRQARTSPAMTNESYWPENS